MSTQSILKAVVNRRTIYALKPELPASTDLNQVQDIVQAIIKDTPTAFNSQSNRAVILTGEAHKKIWGQVVDAIEGDYGKKRPASARDEAFGSVIFFTDDSTTEKLQAGFPAWAAAFPDFAVASSGSAQITTWSALAASDVYGHLQHYNGYVKAALGDSVPKEWTVQAQLVFGSKVAEPDVKTYIDNKVEIISVL